ncbi:hypothetical protein C5S29_07290 [ANME-1 cluster archaeon GoMg3.2]|nr:hypothetical protein [ANME-1 cluster archaeon GoMg3.2]
MKKMILRLVLSTLVLIAILVMPASVLAVTDRDVSNGTDETVSALGCDAYIKIDDPCCNGYCVYVDGAYKLTEGGSGNPDGFCAFYVCAGTHTIKITKNGRSASITKCFQSGSTYSWVSMPYCWCDYHHEPIPDHCQVYIEVQDPCCKGYCVYVDGTYILTEGASGNPDGYCAFYVSAGTHKFELRMNGYSTSKSWYCHCGTDYIWVSMPCGWCANGNCQVYVQVDDNTCVGYYVYVDGAYILTEGESGNPDGYCAFYVSEGTHKFELRKTGYSTSKSWYCQCGTVYRWVSMPDYWCGDAYEHPPPVIPAPQVAKPVLTSPLKISPEKDKYYVGDTIRAEFTVKNVGGAPITLDKLLVGGRFNGGKLPNGQFPDFTPQSTTLPPNGQYRYTGSLTLTQPGNYHFFIAYYIENPTSEEKKLLDENNWNTCVDLGDGLTDADRDQSTKVGSAKSDGDVPFFSQRDSKWNDQKLGKSKWTIGDSGCALTSAAMVSKYFGWDIDPLRLDAALTEIDGIAPNGNLDWPKVEEASGGYVNWRGKKTHQKRSNIDQELSQNNPCIINAHFTDAKGKDNLHYVVIREKVGSEYQFWDPADDDEIDRIWPKGARKRTYTWGKTWGKTIDPRIYLYNESSRPSEKNQISVKDKPPYFYKWSNSGHLDYWLKKNCEGHTYYETYVGGMSEEDGSTLEPDCWMEFTPYLQSAGKYDIYVGICADSTRSTKVNYTVYPNGIDGSSKTVSVNQYSDKESWKEIKLGDGTWDLSGCGKTHVKITDATGEACDGKKTLCVGTINFTKVTIDDTLNILTPTQTAY